jgi:hypothetical protein
MGDGNTAGRFLSGLLQAGHDRADKAKEEQNKRRDDEISMYRDAAKTALQQGDTERASIALKKIDELYKLPKGKSPFAQLGEFLSKVGKKKDGTDGTGGQGEAQPAGSQAAGPDAGGGGQPVAGAAAGGAQKPGLPPLEGGQPAANASASPGKPGGQPAGPPAAAPPSPGPGKSAGRMVTKAFDKAARGLGTGMTKVADTISPKPKELPPLDINAFPTGGGKSKKLGQYDGDDHKTHIIMERADGATYEVDGSGKKLDTGGSKFPRVLPPISMTEAQAQVASSGTAYTGVDGQPLDLGKYNENWQLVPIYLNGKVQYEPTSQGIAHLTVGNEVYTVPKLDMGKLGTEGTAQGASRTGTSSLNAYTGIGEDNQIERVPGQRTPDTPGLQPSPAGSPSGSPSGSRFGTGLPPLSEQGKPRTPGPAHPVSGAPLPAASQRTASDPGAPGSAPHKSGRVAKSLPVPISLWSQQQQVARPVREGATQVFGDPSQPSMKSLKDYAPLADDKAAADRMAVAFNITFSNWDQEIKEAGGLTHLVETAGGYPQLLAQLQASVREDAIGKLANDQEKDYYDSVMSSYGAIIGLRSLTKASAAQFSATAIERELPLVGINTFSTRQYYDQLHRLAEQVYNGTRTMVDQVMPPEEKLYYKNQVEALGKLRDQSKGSGNKKALPGLGPRDPGGLYPEDVNTGASPN